MTGLTEVSKRRRKRKGKAGDSQHKKMGVQIKVADKDRKQRMNLSEIRGYRDSGTTGNSQPS